MKEYTSVRAYGLNLPPPWYMKDDTFDENFRQQEEYIVWHLLKNKQKIKYHFDCNGFRKSHTLDDSKLWFFGCSHTFGQSVEYDNCFSKIAAEQLDMPFYNFGTPGGSINLVTRLLYKLKSKLKDKKIVIFLPYFARFETIVDNEFRNLHPKNKDYGNFIPIENVNGFLKYNTLQSIMLMHLLLSDVQHLILTSYNADEINHFNTVNIESCLVDIAGDGWHFGIESHKNIANFIVNHVKS